MYHPLEISKIFAHSNTEDEVKKSARALRYIMHDEDDDSMYEKVRRYSLWRLIEITNNTFKNGN
tara:strand:- start:979 stop:1170 length:192 start_codon:yes stop_codon:yes gene_type:complete